VGNQFRTVFFLTVLTVLFVLLGSIFGRGGAKISGDPIYLADALEKLAYGNKKFPLRGVNPSTSHMLIVNPLKGNGIITLFSTHPPIEERIKRLRRMAW